MATLTDMEDTIKELGATGVLSYREGQNSVQFRSANDLIALKREAAADANPPTFSLLEIVDL